MNYILHGIPFMSKKEVEDQCPPDHVHIGKSQQVIMHDARKLLQTYNSKAEFFEEHGFVLLNIKEIIKEWTDDPKNTDLKPYQNQIDEALKNELYPGQKYEAQHTDFFLRRGKNSNNNFYAEGVHQDYAATPKEYAEAIDVYCPKDLPLGS